jgi:hypothetical protein
MMLLLLLRLLLIVVPHGQLVSSWPFAATTAEITAEICGAVVL